jgi:hypothetical protein
MAWKCRKSGCNLDAVDNSNFCEEHGYSPDIVTKFSSNISSVASLSQLIFIRERQLNAKLEFIEAAGTDAGGKVNLARFTLNTSNETMGEIVIREDMSGSYKVWIQNRLVSISFYRK